ncbi:MAG: YeeE/YedE family protein [Syntrophobacterales bacterium]|nr:MAG: YeeE/YedE family protein [Syntrophobacterales bacterium]
MVEAWNGTADPGDARAIAWWHGLLARGTRMPVIGGSDFHRHEPLRTLGTPTTFVRAAGFIEERLAPEHVKNNAYFAKEKVKIDWQFMLVVGVFIGALAASLADGSFKVEAVPPVWRERFGNSAGVRAVGAFLGGTVAMFGARMADGCPSGHGLSGLMQLSISGFVALTCFFGAGVLVAALVYRGAGGVR